MIEAYMDNDDNIVITEKLLDKILAHHQAESKEEGWISITIGLPELNESVLIFKPSDFPPEDKVYVGWLSENNKWCEEDGPDGIIFPDEVTHWMPLPAPPLAAFGKEGEG